MFLQPISGLHIALGSRCEEVMKNGLSTVTCALHTFAYGTSAVLCNTHMVRLRVLFAAEKSL